MEKFYPIYVVPIPADEGGGYLGFVPDLKGCMSPGDTPEEALANTRQASKEWIEESKAQNREIPEPGSAVAAARKEREALLIKIHDQDVAMGKFEHDVAEIRTALAKLTERLTAAEVLPWGSFVTQHAMSNGCDSDEIVH